MSCSQNGKRRNCDRNEYSVVQSSSDFSFLKNCIENRLKITKYIKMKKILAFAGSTSSTSINKKLATFAAENLENTSFDVIDLRDFTMPIYSEDEEKNGFPEDAKKLSLLLDNYDGFILSLAEHNGSYAAAFKSIFDQQLEGLRNKSPSASPSSLYESAAILALGSFITDRKLNPLASDVRLR